MSEAPYAYATTGRNWATLATVLCVWGVVLGLVLWIALAPWIAWAAFIVTLPAVYDLVSAREAGLTLDDTTIAWNAGTKSGEVAVAQIDHIRFDTRLDFSVRVTLVLKTGQRVKLPFEATPPHRAFEAELTTRGLRTQRHHFGFV